MQNQLQTTVYRDCVSPKCAFFISDGQLFCSNCGVEQREEYISQSDILFIVALILLLISGFVAFAVVRSVFVEPKYFILFIISCASFGVAAWWLLKSFTLSGRIKERGFVPLIESEALIKKRLADISAKRARVTDVLNRISPLKEQKWEGLHKKLNDVLGILHDQSSRYQIKLREIDFLRWQNEFTPAFFNLQGLSFDGTKAYLNGLEKFMAHGRSTYQQLEVGLKTLKDTSEGRTLMQRFRETLASCQKLKETLIEQQALEAIKDISPVEGDLKPVSLPSEVIKQVEVFNAQADITDFSNSFQELEAEFLRIEAEQEIGEETSSLLGTSDS